jgi:nucleotide-binding universal stress UspA family protein
LVCIDLSPQSALVLAAADEVAADRNARLHVLYVAEGEPALVGYDPPGGVHDRREHASEVEADRARLDDLVAAADLRSPIEILVVAGPTVESILEVADGIDAAMIVVGRGAHGGVLERILGSVATDLVRRATRPVLVVPVHR